MFKALSTPVTTRLKKVRVEKYQGLKNAPPNPIKYLIRFCSTHQHQVLEMELWSEVVGALSSLLLLLLSLVCALLLLLRRRPRLNLPPRPSPRLPLLGDILHLRHLNQNPHSYLDYLCHRLGPIFTLSLGRIPFIYITSASLVHEALVEKGRIFAARPQLPSRAVITGNYRSINTSSYGAHWRTMRRNLVQEMLTIPKVLSFKSARIRILDNLISRMQAEAQQNEGIVSVYSNLHRAMVQLLLFMCFGFDMSEDALLEMSDLIVEILRLPVSSLTDFYPSLKLFNGLSAKPQVSLPALRARQLRVFTSHIEKHRELGKLGQLTKGSYVETLLRMEEAGTVFLAEDLVTFCTEFLVGGIDTTATTLEWAMARLVLHPDIQCKLYDEIHGVTGDRPVDEEDLPQLPYLRSIVKETLRLHPAFPFLLPHTVSEPCKIGDYDIPMGSIVLFTNAYISRDPKVWHEPLMFKPERFLVADVDITGIKEVTMVPFGAGRRICPGLGLGIMHTELFVARLVQALEWAMHPLEETVDLSEKNGFTIGMKHSLRALVKERKSAML
ncbi:hypothetical protein L7F22_005967 [Adiantum nelumboides]|nr:hypothetical protein [Adiantum nelumboides]